MKTVHTRLLWKLNSTKDITDVLGCGVKDDLVISKGSRSAVRWTYKGLPCILSSKKCLGKNIVLRIGEGNSTILPQEIIVPLHGKSKHKLVQGVGVNDLSAPINKYRYYVEDGKRKREILWVCKIYVAWTGMLSRCYCTKTQERQPTYKGCSVCEEWLVFSNFKYWMENQDWQGKQLDKDLLVEGNKVYSPETCILVPTIVNTFILENHTRQGECLVGVTCRKYKNTRRYEAACRNPLTKNKDYLGTFDTELEAHLAWKKRKGELVVLLYDNGYIESEVLYQLLKFRYKLEGGYCFE